MKHLKGVVKDYMPFLMHGRNVVQTDLRVVSRDPKIPKHRCERHAQYLLHYYHIAGLMFALFGFFPELKLRLSGPIGSCRSSPWCWSQCLTYIFVFWPKHEADRHYCPDDLECSITSPALCEGVVQLACALKALIPNLHQFCFHHLQFKPF